VVFFEGGLVRSIARQQQSVSLSSCEAELLLESELFCIGITCWSRYSEEKQHVEIRLAWMKSKMASGELEIEHRAGTENVADLFTKCLSTRDFLRHRASLGFEAVEVPARRLQWKCCGTNSALRDACRVARMPYVGVVKEVETDAMFARVKQFVDKKPVIVAAQMAIDAMMPWKVEHNRHLAG